MAASTSRVLNFNIGVLGHVDSGKTSLAKALSTVASTAAFDKNPQSKERGITLDLGFSSFSVDLPEHLPGEKYDRLLITLVDCPGHASLIKTIIGGAQIIDLMMLVIDVTKGMQTQSAECLIIGEITCSKMVIVLNKTDLLPAPKKTLMIEKMTKRMLKTLENTKFADCPIIAVAAKPGGPDSPDTEAQGVETLIEELKRQAYLPCRDATGPMLYAVDHCFSIRGQGTVMTGTMLSGRVAVNDTVEIPALKITRKVKSMQMFRHPVQSAAQGDRVGVCVTQFDPKQLERGLVCTPSTLPTVFAGIIAVKKIPYFKGACSTKAKFHVTMGHETVMGRVFFFGLAPKDGVEGPSSDQEFSFEQEYIFQEELLSPLSKSTNPTTEDKENHQPAVPSANEQWALVEFEKPVACPARCLVIGSKLDTDIHSNICRLAFHGQLLHHITDKNYADTILPQLKIYKNKSREGVVDRMMDEYSIIGRSLFKKETNLQIFVGLKVELSTGEEGVIEGGFGQSGKFKIRIPNGLRPETVQQLSASGKKKGKKASKAEDAGDAATPADDGSEASSRLPPIKISLRFKRYVYDPKKKMIQA
ncbi:selenocysteine-specific elongation factor-like [Acanthaster planci]|uniref:Selenocysteine-specific elongation factor n=1 Tax=Acanthaster planci TaxID=133434 RepID=A0A8B7XJN2_ACAPL|nr:selenocysteine-specific elongation factor-like [Acanthaster planci]